MHELSIAQALVEQLDEIVRREGAVRVAAVTVTVGSLSGVEPDALDMAFPVAAESSVAAGAALALELVPARALCHDCRLEFEAGFPFFVCERCGSDNVEIGAGRELLISSVELAYETREQQNV